jgi:hypothetical protein
MPVSALSPWVQGKETPLLRAVSLLLCASEGCVVQLFLRKEPSILGCRVSTGSEKAWGENGVERNSAVAVFFPGWPVRPFQRRNFKQG